jgi:hypothetical protein
MDGLWTAPHQVSQAVDLIGRSSWADDRVICNAMDIRQRSKRHFSLLTYSFPRVLSYLDLQLSVCISANGSFIENFDFFFT